MRFHAKHEPENEAGCWIWSATTNWGGYGQFYLGGRLVGAHKAAHQLFKGPVPDGVEVCHTCDVRNCVNPAHVFIGTKSDNMKDAAEKGRLAHRTAKLTSEQADEVRRSTERGVDIAKRLGVSQNIISRIRRGQSYEKPHALRKAA